LIQVQQQQYLASEEIFLNDVRKYLTMKPDSDSSTLTQTSLDICTKKLFLDLQRYDLDALSREIEDRERLSALRTLKYGLVEFGWRQIEIRTQIIGPSFCFSHHISVNKLFLHYILCFSQGCCSCAQGVL
jgi:hypothetical protein